MRAREQIRVLSLLLCETRAKVEEAEARAEEQADLYSALLPSAAGNEHKLSTIAAYFGIPNGPNILRDLVNYRDKLLASTLAERDTARQHLAASQRENLRSSKALDKARASLRAARKQARIERRSLRSAVHALDEIAEALGIPEESRSKAEILRRIGELKS